MLLSSEKCAGGDRGGQNIDLKRTAILTSDWVETEIFGLWFLGTIELEPHGRQNHILNISETFAIMVFMYTVMKPTHRPKQAEIESEQTFIQNVGCIDGIYAFSTGGAGATITA